MKIRIEHGPANEISIARAEPGLYFVTRHSSHPMVGGAVVVSRHTINRNEYFVTFLRGGDASITLPMMTVNETIMVRPATAADTVTINGGDEP